MYSQLPSRSMAAHNARPFLHQDAKCVCFPASIDQFFNSESGRESSRQRLSTPCSQLVWTNATSPIAYVSVSAKTISRNFGEVHRHLISCSSCKSAYHLLFLRLAMLTASMVQPTLRPFRDFTCADGRRIGTLSASSAPPKESL